MSDLPGVRKHSTEGVLGGGDGVLVSRNCLQGSLVPNVVMSSGMKEDVYNFQWKIESFATIREHDYLIRSQQVRVTTDAGLQWSISLSLGANARDKAFIGVMRRLVDAPSADDKVFSSMDLEVMKKSFVQPEMVQMKPGSKLLGWNSVIPKNSDTEKLQLVDGTLTINVKLRTFITLPVTTKKRKSQEEFEYTSAKQMRKDFGSLLNESEPDNDDTTSTLESSYSNNRSFSDVTVISKDGTEFRAHKAILAARSSVFKAMFQSNLLETQTGVVKIEDVSGKVFKILLAYIYGGELSKEWNASDIFEEFCYAVDKYQLIDLREFLDNILGEICTDQTAVKFLEVAERFSLKNAEMQCMKYVKDHGWLRANNLSDLVKLFNSE